MFLRLTKKQMPSTKAPRRGSMQFWHRRRAKKPIARVRSWANSNEAKPLGFAGYKVGMASVIYTDNRPTSMTKGETIVTPVTIIECPAIKVASIIFYKNKKILTSVMAEKIDKELAKKITTPKQVKKKVDDIKDFDDIRLLVYTQPKLTGIGKKKPEIFEVGIGGKPEEKLNYAKEVLGKEISIEQVFKEGQQVDIHAVTTGKGFQGAVKRFGVAILRRKSEKKKRGPATLGDWKHKNLWRVAYPGQMGYHNRFEHNKQIFKLGKDPKEVNPKSGFERYGLVKGNYILVKGSVGGPRKRTIIFTEALRPNTKLHSEMPEMKVILK